MWLNKWRDDIALFLTKQQWACPTVGLHEIGAHVERPFFLPARVKLLETLQLDPLQRFIVTGVGNDTRIMIRTFRGDEPEIGEYVEHWRLVILQYMLSKCAALGVSQPLLGLSEIGANVPRPPGVPTSVKLIDVMRGDPMVRFLVKGEGNALRARINPNCRHLLPSMLAGLPPLPMPLQTHGAYTAEGEYIPGSGGGANSSSSHYGGGGPSMMYGGGMGGGGHRPPMMPHHHQSSHFNDNHSEDGGSISGGYGQHGYEGQHRPSPSSYRPSVPMAPPPARLVGYGSNGNDYDDNDYFDNDNSNNNNNNAYPRSSGGGGTAQQSALRQLHQLHQHSGHGPPPGVSGPYSGHGQSYHPSQSMDHHHRSNGGSNNYRSPSGSASNAGANSYRMGGSGSSTHSMNSNSATSSAHGIGSGAGNLAGGYALALGGGGYAGMGGSSSYGQRQPPLHTGSPLDYRSTNGGSLHGMTGGSNSSSGGGLTALGGGIFGTGGMAASPSQHNSSIHNDSSASSASGGMGLSNMSSLFSGLGGDSNVGGGMAPGDDQEWQRALGLTGGQTTSSSGLSSPSMHQLPSFSGTSKSTATTMESLDNNSGGGSTNLFREQRASSAAATIQQQQSLSSFSSSLGGLTDGSVGGHEHLAVGNSKTSPSSMQHQQLLHSDGGFMSSFDDPSLPDNSNHIHNDSSSLHSRSSSSNHVIGSNLNSTGSAALPQPKDPNQPSVAHLKSFGALDSRATDEFDDEDGDGAIAHPPLDKWMIKVWLPLVFEGFEYDLIDSFVNRLRDDGGFVTVQDLLDAQARGELARQSLADIAGFKVGHCNRLDRALAMYTSNNNNKVAALPTGTSPMSSLPQELATPTALASSQKESMVPGNTTASVEETVGADADTTIAGAQGQDATSSSPASGGGTDNPRRPSIRALVVEKPLQ